MKSLSFYRFYLTAPLISNRHIGAIGAVETQIRVQFRGSVHANDGRGLRLFLWVKVDVGSLESAARSFCVAFDNDAFYLLEVGKTLVVLRSH